MSQLSAEMATECCICFETFQRQGNHTPKMLPMCLHTVCLLCLQHLRDNNNRITCPECRVVSIAPPGGVQAFATDRFVFKTAEREAELEETKRALDDATKRLEAIAERAEERVPVLQRGPVPRYGGVQQPEVVVAQPEVNIAGPRDRRCCGDCSCAAGCDEQCAPCCQCVTFCCPQGGPDFLNRDGRDDRSCSECCACASVGECVARIFLTTIGILFGLPVAVFFVISIICLVVFYYWRTTIILIGHCCDFLARHRRCQEVGRNFSDAIQKVRDDVQSYFGRRCEQVLELYESCYGCEVVMAGVYRACVWAVLIVVVSLSLLVSIVTFLILVFFVPYALYGIVRIAMAIVASSGE